MRVIIRTLLILLGHSPHVRHQTHMVYEASTIILHSLQIITLRLGEAKHTHTQSTHSSLVVGSLLGSLLSIEFIFRKELQGENVCT